jgi:hypothetical protein
MPETADHDGRYTHLGTQHGDIRSDMDAEKPPDRGRGGAGKNTVAHPDQGVGHGDRLQFADPVEVALADALSRASAAGEWSTVAQLARELEARREASAGVVRLDAARAARRER